MEISKIDNTERRKLQNNIYNLIPVKLFLPFVYYYNKKKNTIVAVRMAEIVHGILARANTNAWAYTNRRAYKRFRGDRRGRGV